MLQRPDTCEWPHTCATDRICWRAKQIEGAAWEQHRRKFVHARRVAQETGKQFPYESFEEYARLVDLEEAEAA